MTKQIDAETESAASDILRLKNKPEALEKFLSTYIAQHDKAQVEKVRQLLENKGEMALSKFVPEAKISPTHIDLVPTKKVVSVGEFRAQAQKDIDDFKKDLAAKTAAVVTVETENRISSKAFSGKFHSEIEGKAKVDFDGGKVEVTDSASGIKYKFDLEAKDKSATVSYPGGSVRTIQGRGKSDYFGATFAANTSEGFIGCASNKEGIVIALPKIVLDIDTRARHLLPGKDMKAEPIETRPPRMYVDKRSESLNSENYGENGSRIENVIAEVKEVEMITNKANEMIAEFKKQVDKQEAAPVVDIYGHTEYGYFVGTLQSEIPGKLKLHHDDDTLVVDDLVSGTKYKFAVSKGKDLLTITDSAGNENSYEGNVELTRGGGGYFDFTAKTPDGNLGFAKNETGILVALPDKVLDIRCQPRVLAAPNELRMDNIEVSPPRMFLDKRDESLAVKKYDSRGVILEHEFERANQSP